MSVPRVSVVIPTYNAPALLAETLATVFAQTFTDFEVVVIDDGSTDDTAERLATIADPRLRVVTQANAGIGAARNRGLDEAFGDYIALLDHDDLWLPGKLAAQVATFEQFPDTVAVITPYAYSTAPAVPVFDPAVADPATRVIARPLLTFSQNHSLFCSSAMMIDRRKSQGLRYDEQRRTIEDQPLHIGLTTRGPIRLSGPDILMIYRWHATNASADALYWLNGWRNLRRRARAGHFAAAETNGTRDLAEFLAYFGRSAATRQLAAGRRGPAMGVYAREWPHQVARRRWKFVLGFPCQWAASWLKPTPGAKGTN